MAIAERITVTAQMVHTLIAQQFPRWAHLSIEPVTVSGWDNYMFRLGEQLVVRLPSAACYADQVQKEHRWLPFLASKLSKEVPEPVALGAPSEAYPWHWSIYRWIKGTSALQAESIQLSAVAEELAAFLHELWQIDTTNGPVPGPHNFYRGGDLSHYDAETRAAAVAVPDRYDQIMTLWERALESRWYKEPVWVHGDLTSGNILLSDEGRLAAIIDFGCLAIGDPAFDLGITWILFQGESRQRFMSLVAQDDATWTRARAWVLWKALITQEKTTNQPQKDEQLARIHEIISD